MLFSEHPRICARGDRKLEKTWSRYCSIVPIQGGSPLDRKGAAEPSSFRTIGERENVQDYLARGRRRGAVSFSRFRRIRPNTDSEEWQILRALRMEGYVRQGPGSW